MHTLHAATDVAAVKVDHSPAAQATHVVAATMLDHDPAAQRSHVDEPDAGE